MCNQQYGTFFLQNPLNKIPGIRKFRALCSGVTNIIHCVILIDFYSKQGTRPPVILTSATGKTLAGRGLISMIRSNFEGEISVHCCVKQSSLSLISCVTWDFMAPLSPYNKYTRSDQRYMIICVIININNHQFHITHSCHRSLCSSAPNINKPQHLDVNGTVPAANLSRKCPLPIVR